MVDKLVEECSKNNDGNEMIYNDFGNVCNSFTIYVILLVRFLLISISMSSVFIYFRWYLEN